jgi:hypothetical protein
MLFFHGLMVANNGIKTQGEKRLYRATRSRLSANESGNKIGDPWAADFESREASSGFASCYTNQAQQSRT